MHLALLIVALILMVMAAFGVSSNKVQLQSLSLSFFLLELVLRLTGS